MDHVSIVREKIDLSAVQDLVAENSCGAISLFLGTTRNHFQEKRVVRLEYEAYDTMALKEMKAICAKLRERWPVIASIAIIHRVGVVPVKEASLAIAVSTPHRKEAQEAVSFALEEVKTRVPIWKKEIYDDEQSAWKENNEWEGPMGLRSCWPSTQANLEQLVQIPMQVEEVESRMRKFIQKKRSEIDYNNVLAFKPDGANCAQSDGSDGLNLMCARTGSVLIKRDPSNGRYKVRRVNNLTGPQTKPKYFTELDKLRPQSQASWNESDWNHDSALKRIADIENHLLLDSSSCTDIFERIKLIESKLLHLEAISPEYRSFLQAPKSAQCDTPKPERHCAKAYTVCDIDRVIGELKK